MYLCFCKGLSAWPSHLARLALAISKWLCSFYHVIFLLGIYLFLLYFLGTKIKIVVVVVVVVSRILNNFYHKVFVQEAITYQL